MNTSKIFFLSLILCLSLGSGVFAQDESADEPVAPAQLIATNSLEDVQSQDLGVETPTLLPDNPFYFLKNWARGIQSFFTADPVKKAELKMKITSEKLLEVKKMVEKNKSEKTVEQGITNYQKGINELKTVTEKIKDKAEENPQVNQFLNKFIQQQTLHQQILEKLETQVSPQAIQKIQEVREQHLERFGEVMNKLETKTTIQQKLEQSLEKATPTVKEAIIKVRNRISEKIQSGSQTFCTQVITPAISPEGTCQEFPTPCNVPDEWKITDKCPVVEKSAAE